MPNLRAPTGRISWPLLATVLAAQFAALCLAWALTHSSWLQAGLLLACFFPLRALSIRAADIDPFPSRTASEVRQREVLLILGFFVLLLVFGFGLDRVLKTSGIYPGPCALVYIGAWVPLAVAWNLFGYQR